MKLATASAQGGQQCDTKDSLAAKLRKVEPVRTGIEEARLSKGTEVTQERDVHMVWL